VQFDQRFEVTTPSGPLELASVCKIIIEPPTLIEKMESLGSYLCSFGVLLGWEIL
jgi:hypothetical protein